MNTIVNKLLDVDREARQMLDEAQQYYERALQEVEVEKNRLLEECEHKAKLHIDTLENQIAAELEESIAGERERTEAVLATMEAGYRERHQQWEDEIFRRVTMPEAQNA